MTRKTKPPVTIYSALADTTRCRIIEILAEGSIPVHRLADAFSISRPAISRHLRVLKQAGLVAEVKKGRENLYAFRAHKLGKAVDWIATFSGPISKQVDESTPEPVGTEPNEQPPQAVDGAIAVAIERPVALKVALPDTTLSGVNPKARSTRKAAADVPVADPISQMGFDF